MKKTLIGLATLAMTLLPSVAVAQTQSLENTAKVELSKKADKAEKRALKAEKKIAKGDQKKDRKDRDDRKAMRGKEVRPGKGKNCSMDCKRAYNDSVRFASLNLNDNQLAKIKALNEARNSSVRGLKEQAKAARAKGDTTFVFDGSKVEMVRSKYLKDLREILTADQYVQFLEDNYVKVDNQGPKGRDMKMVKKGNKGQLPIQGSGRMIKPAKKAER